MDISWVGCVSNPLIFFPTNNTSGSICSAVFSVTYLNAEIDLLCPLCVTKLFQHKSSWCHCVTSVPVSSCVLPLNINFFKPPKRLQYHKAGKFFFFTQHIELSDVFDTFPKNYVYTEIRSLCTLHTAEDILAFNNALVYTAWLPLHRNWVKLVTLLVIWLLSIIVPLVSKEW